MEANTGLEVLLRPAREADRNFILSSWLRSFRDAPYFIGWDNARYFSDTNGYQAVVKKILANPATQTIVASSADDNDHILGWICFRRDPPAIHYCYVKQAFRGGELGIAKILAKTAVPDLGNRLTQCSSTAPGWSTLREKYRLVFNPWEGV